MCPPCSRGRNRNSHVQAYVCLHPQLSGRLCTEHKIARASKAEGVAPRACSLCDLKTPIITPVEQCIHRGQRLSLGDQELYECLSPRRRHHPVCTLESVTVYDGALTVLSCERCKARE